MASAAMGQTMARAWNPGSIGQGLPGTIDTSTRDLERSNGRILSYAREAKVSPAEMGQRLTDLGAAPQSAVLKAVTDFKEDPKKVSALTGRDGRVNDLKEIAANHFDQMDMMERVSFRSLQRAAMRGKASPEVTADRLESFAQGMERSGNVDAARDVMTRACHHDAAARQAVREKTNARAGDER
jgi:hypothetical protein